MKTIVIPKPVHPLALYGRALWSGFKRPVAVAALPEVRYVRPQVVLDATHIAGYARVCGFGAGQGVPLTYPQMLTFPLVMAYLGSVDCPWPALGLVHLANRIVQRQALHSGDAVRVELRSGRLLAHDKGQVFTLELQVFRDDVPVWEASQSLIRVGVQHPMGEPYVSTLGAPAQALVKQMEFAAPADLGRRYARVSGDFNPIHLSATSARLFGFRQAIAHGMWTKARALAALLPQAATGQAEVAVEFKTPLFLPATAALWASRDTPDSNASRARSTHFEVRNARGEKPHLRGHLRCGD